MEKELQVVQAFFEGRIWPRVQNIVDQHLIERAIELGYFEVIQGIEQLNKIHICKRCLNDSKSSIVAYTCANCSQICYYCRHCIKMGRITSCTQLLRWCGEEHERLKVVEFIFDGSLTSLQQQASQQLMDSIERNKSHLLVAVCGAGKTEVLFEPIAKALQKGLRVCIATPRTDVVLELLPRFRKVFPSMNVQGLYGGADINTEFTQLVIATTHQLYRFENTFDLIIVDEADAFPYTMDITLQKAVSKAKKLSAPVIYVTATPSHFLKQLVQKGEIVQSFIPKRYHNYPLPVPKIEQCYRYEKLINKGALPRQLMKWLNKCLEKNQPFLVFFPTIKLMNKAIQIAQNIEPLIESVHAQDEQRKEKVLALRNKQYKGLFTTTILERGITISDVQVAVVGAENKVFTSSALIQISGRVGRDKNKPTGEIIFFHHGISVEMDEAVNEIKKLNALGFSM